MPDVCPFEDRNMLLETKTQKYIVVLGLKLHSLFYRYKLLYLTIYYQNCSDNFDEIQPVCRCFSIVFYILLSSTKILYCFQQSSCFGPFYGHDQA